MSGYGTMNQGYEEQAGISWGAVAGYTALGLVSAGMIRMGANAFQGAARKAMPHVRQAPAQLSSYAKQQAARARKQAARVVGGGRRAARKARERIGGVHRIEAPPDLTGPQVDAWIASQLETRSPFHQEGLQHFLMENPYERAVLPSSSPRHVKGTPAADIPRRGASPAPNFLDALSGFNNNGSQYEPFEILGHMKKKKKTRTRGGNYIARNEDGSFTAIQAATAT